MPSGYAVAILIFLCPALASWFWSRAGPYVVQRNYRNPRSEVVLDAARYDVFGRGVFKRHEHVYSFGFTLALLPDPNRACEALGEDFKRVLAMPAPLDPASLRGALAPASPVPSAVEELQALRSGQDPPAPDLVDRVVRHRASLDTWAARRGILILSAFVLVATVVLAVYPLVTRGDSLLSPWVHLGREMNRESAQILLCGGIVVLLFAVVGWVRVLLAWRPVVARWREFLLAVAPRLQANR